jgi:hypothetical protein
MTSKEREGAPVREDTGEKQVQAASPHGPGIRRFTDLQGEPPSPASEPDTAGRTGDAMHDADAEREFRTQLEALARSGALDRLLGLPRRVVFEAAALERAMSERIAGSTAEFAEGVREQIRAAVSAEMQRVMGQVSAANMEKARAESMREALHALVNELPERGLEAATRYLAALRDDPVFLSCETAPPDDEELTPEQRDRIADAVADAIRGSVEYVSDEALAQRISG